MDELMQMIHTFSVYIRQSDSIKVELYFSIKQHAMVNAPQKFNISLCFMFAYFLLGLFDC